MNKKHILILGAGISGLSAAWKLSQIAPECSITILEASQRAGGWIKSSSIDDFFFEMGPRVFKASKSKALLTLIEELGMQDQITIADCVKDRHILWKGKLHKLPQTLLSFLSSSLTRPLILPLLTEWRKKPLTAYDESVEEFIVRRFGRDVLDRLFDPLTQGIYAASPKEISIRSCFGMLKDLEDHHQSITAGFLHKMRQKKPTQNLPMKDSSLFTLKGGVETLVESLIKKTKATIHYGQNVLSVSGAKEGLTVKTANDTWKADAVFVALPSSESAKVLQNVDKALAQRLQDVPSVSITSVLLGFSRPVLSQKGFGYLVPGKENLNILGAVFDSEAFAAQSKTEKETRITLMLKGSGYSREEIEENVELALKQHLGIQEKPETLHVQVSENSIPKFLVGHKDKMAFLDRDMNKILPNCFLLGNYLNGVSVSDCIKHSEKQVLLWASQAPSFGSEVFGKRIQV